MSSADMSVSTVNPATGQLIKDYPLMTAQQIDAAVLQASTSFQSWRKLEFSERASLILKLKTLLLDEAESLAELITEEMGKPLSQAVAEVKKCASVCEYYARNAEAFLMDQTLPSDSTDRVYISFQPLGPILGIMPWNFPFWQVLRFAVPTLMAGNTVLMKHSPNTSGCSLLISKLFESAGFPEGVFTSLIASVEDIQGVIADPRVRGVSLTGSTRAGREVAALCGKHLKKVVLELGGSDPYVILSDADVPAAVEKCTLSRMLNAGQSCVAAKRWIVTPENKQQLCNLLLANLESQIMGDPMDGSSTIGPMAREDLRDNLHRQVEESVKQGAKLLCGGVVPARPGFYYPPTVLTDVTPEMIAFNEELFGPVIVVIEAKDDEHALQLANQTEYGLGGAVFSRNQDRAETWAREELQAGNCFVNEFVRSDARWPFGGIKDSGFGRELSVLGIHEFVNAKTVLVPS